MPNRRQQIKYQGLQAYRQRQQMRRMQGDGRNPYGSEGGYVTSSRQGQDGLMMQDMRAYQQGMYPGSLSDMTMQHQPIHHDPYMPRDYAMNNQGMNRNMPMDYAQSNQGMNNGQGGYNQGQNRNIGDYGESLSSEDLEKWCKKLKEQLDEREKSMFSKQAIMQHAKQIGRSMEGFGEKELEVATLMIYTDYKNSIGQNLDLAVRLAFDWLNDKDTAVKGAEKLAIYHDCIVEGDDD